mgnify:CR=1 FL=1|tara:strand:- start:665 stop:1237 length:573 start_codon:yes stop_codon:yes gene_type:complete
MFNFFILSALCFTVCEGLLLNAPPRVKEITSSCLELSPFQRPSFHSIGQVLYLSRVEDCLAGDPAATTFWIQCCGSRKKISYFDFLEEYCIYFNVDSFEYTNSSPLKRYLTESVPDFITLDDFATTVRYFGPFTQDMLLQVRQVVATGWFWGQTDEETCLEALRECKNSYLVRFATTAGSFTFTGMQSEH